MNLKIDNLKYQKLDTSKKKLFFQYDKDKKLLVRHKNNILFFGKIFSFDYKNRILMINDDIYELNNKFNFTTKEIRLSFCKVLGVIDPNKDKENYMNEKSMKWQNKFKAFILQFIKNLNNDFEAVIYDLIENQRVPAKNNELIQALRNLLIDMGLCKTYNKYLLPLQNNITVTIDENELLHIISQLTNIRNMSIDTVKETLKYFNQEIPINYHMIKTNNGYYDFELKQFFEQSDEILIINKKTPYNYRSELIGTEPPSLLKKFFDTTFCNEEWKIQALLQIFGYMLDDGNQFQIMPVLIGKTRAGKGVCFKLVSNMVNNNVSTVDVFNVDFDSKYTQTLITADINIVEEWKGCKNYAAVKNYVGEGGLTIARIYEEPRVYPDIEVPKTMLSTNNLGGIVKGMDAAFMERLRCILEFNYTIPREKRDNKLVEKLTSDPEVMDWLLTNSLYEYSAIKDTGNFACLKSMDEMDEIIEKYQNPKTYYLKKNFKYDLEAYETEKDMGAFENLVRITDIRECLYKELELKVKQVKSDVEKAFNLRQDVYEKYKDEYIIEDIYNPATKQNVKCIRGLVKRTNNEEE